MPLGTRKYDELCTFVRERTHAVGAFVVVFHGDKGTGFSLQTYDEGLVSRLPQILRIVADEIEKNGSTNMEN